MRYFLPLILFSISVFAQDPRGVHRFTSQMIHPSVVTSMAFSPDGNKLYSGSGDGTVKIWNVRTGKETLMLAGHSGSVKTVSISHDGSRILSGGSDGSIIIWDDKTGNKLQEFGKKSRINSSIAISPDGGSFACAGEENIIIIWDAKTGKEIRKLKGHSSYVTTINFSPDGAHIVSGGNDKTLRVWDTRTGNEVRRLPVSEGLISAKYSPDGSRIMSCNRDFTFKVWDARTGEVVPIFNKYQHFSKINSIAFSPDGKLVASGSAKAVRLWDAKTGLLVKTLEGHSGDVISVAFSSDGMYVASGGSDSQIKIWNVLSGKETELSNGRSAQIKFAAFSPDGTRVVSAGPDNTAKIWNADSGDELRILKGHTDPIKSLSFSLDGKRIVTGGRDNAIKIWDAVTGTEVLTMRGHTAHVNSVAFSPDGKNVVSGSCDKTIMIWDTQTGARIHTLAGHSDWVSSVAFSSDGRRIVSGGFDHAVKIWDAVSGKEIRTLNGHPSYINTVAFSADGRRVVCANAEKFCKIWDANTGRELQTLRGNSNQLNAAAFSPNGRLIAFGGDDKTVKIWDGEAGKLASEINFNFDIKQIAFNDQGDSLYIATTAYWTKLPIGGNVPKRIKAEPVLLDNKKVIRPVNPSIADFAAFFWHDAAIRNGTEERPGRYDQKVIHMSGQWNGNFDMRDARVSLLLNGRAITLNGKGLSSDKRMLHEINVSQTITLKEGSNYIQWKLQIPDGKTFESEIKYLYYDDLSQPNLYLYAFGVESHDLKFTKDDALYVKKLFQTQQGSLFRQVFATAITGENTEAGSIRTQLEQISNNDHIRPQDVLLLFFSTHGLPTPDRNFILQARGYNPMAPISTTITYQKDILAYLEHRQSKRVILLDACFSGGGAKAAADVGKALADTPPGWVVLSSSSGTERSFEHQDWKHGSFTYALIKALEKGEADADRNGIIYLTELFSYLEKEVPKQNSIKKLDLQHPQIKKELVQDFPIFIVK